MPELLLLCDLEVRIPRIELVALERLAARDGKSVDSVVASELRDLVSAQSEWRSRVVPGSKQRWLGRIRSEASVLRF
jgi:hypothetical protein